MSRIFSFTALCTLLAAAGCGGETTPVDLGNPNAPAPPSNGATGDRGGAIPPGQVTPGTTSTPNTAIEIVVANQQAPSLVAVGGDKLFFAPESGQAYDIYRFDLAKSHNVPVGIQNTTQLFVADDKGFFARTDTGIVGSAVDGCTLYECDSFVPQLAATSPGTVKAIALAGDYVYWATQAPSPAWTYELYRTTRTLGARYETATPVEGELLKRWTDIGITTLVVDGNRLFGGGERELFSFDTSTDDFRIVLADGPRGNFVADATHLYWLSASGVMRRPKAGGANELVADFAKEQRAESFVAGVGKSGVYVLTHVPLSTTATGRLLHVSKDGKNVRELATGLAGVRYGVVSGGYFYWTNQNAGTIARVRDE